MRYIKLFLGIPTLFLFLLALNIGCDNENNSNAAAQPAPMSGTDVTGKVNAPSEQTCPTLIGGISASDTIVVEIESTGDKSGDATITDSTAGTSAMCSGTTEDTLPPAEVKECMVSSSNISGIKADDEMEIAVSFSGQSKEVTLANLSSPDGITCAFVTIETINANN